MLSPHLSLPASAADENELTIESSLLWPLAVVVAHDARFCACAIALYPFYENAPLAVYHPFSRETK